MVQYKRLIKQVLSIPSTVADPAVYLLSGVLQVEAVIHKRILSLFGNITRLPNESAELQLAKRQLDTKTYKSHSWFIVVKKVLLRYELPSPEASIESPVEKLSRKHQCNKAVNNYWSTSLVIMTSSQES